MLPNPKGSSSKLKSTKRTSCQRPSMIYGKRQERVLESRVTFKRNVLENVSEEMGRIHN